MKKRDNGPILYYIASALFYMASILSFTSGGNPSMAVVWLCLGSSFLCFGSAFKKKETGKANPDGKKIPPDKAAPQG